MSKKYFYPIQEQIDDCRLYLAFLKNGCPPEGFRSQKVAFIPALEMSTHEMEATRRKLEEEFSWVRNEDFVQTIPVHKVTGDYLYPERYEKVRQKKILKAARKEETLFPLAVDIQP